MRRGPVAKLKVVAKAGTPPVPRWVPRIAVDAYERAAAELASKDRMTPGNAVLLEQYVGAVAAARRAERSIARQGSFFREKGKRPQPHPGFAVQAEAQKQIRMLASRLGLIEESRDAARKAAGQTVDIDDDGFAEDDI